MFSDNLEKMQDAAAKVVALERAVSVLDAMLNATVSVINALNLDVVFEMDTISALADKSTENNRYVNLEVSEDDVVVKLIATD